MKPTEAHSEVFANTRELVKFINEHGLRNIEIVDILYIGGQLFLIYFE